MSAFLHATHYDLITPDGVITDIQLENESSATVTLFIESISPLFVGFSIDPDRLSFNIKSTLAQVGVDGKATEIALDKKTFTAEVKIQLCAIDALGKVLLKLLKKGAWIGKLFATDDRRRVRDPDYLSRMFGRSDREGLPLLSLGGLYGSSDLILDKIDGRTVAYLTLQNGKVLYDDSIRGFLPTLAKALIANVPMRENLKLHQEWHPFLSKNVEEGELLLVKTLPLHIRTVFGKVVDSFLAEGYRHTSANILQPDTSDSGDIYEFYGNSKREISDIPLEFYTLEPYREHVFFQDRDQLKKTLEAPSVLFEAFSTGPLPKELPASVFVVKGNQMASLTPEDWIVRETYFHDFPGLHQGSRQALMVERYIEQQPSFPFLQALESGKITSQGILLTRYFPSPLLKRLFLSNQVQRLLKGIYFTHPSRNHGDFFSAEDRALLHDLEKFAIPIFWVDGKSGHILQYTQKPNYDSGMFVPLPKVEEFLKSTVLGIYGSNLDAGPFETELTLLLQGILAIKNEVNHPLLSKSTPLAMVTGGGPGVMEMANKVAQKLGILSCANIVDFQPKSGGVINEQRQNPYIDAKMTYRLDKLIERQSEFNLDLAIFLVGGIGTDFEFSLEEVRRKVGATAPLPILLFGPLEYWRNKISSRFHQNVQTKTIRGSEWISNCFYVVESGKEGIEVWRRFFLNQLAIGPQGPIYEEGFATIH